MNWVELYDDTNETTGCYEILEAAEVADNVVLKLTHKVHSGYDTAISVTLTTIPSAMLEYNHITKHHKVVHIGGL